MDILENFQKVDDGTLAVDRVKNETKTVNYAYDYLISQRNAIIKQRDDDNAKRDEELAEIDLLIAEAEKLGIKATQPVLPNPI